jgi:hypothetical protein
VRVEAERPGDAAAERVVQYELQRMQLGDFVAVNPAARDVR